MTGILLLRALIHTGNSRFNHMKIKTGITSSK